MGNSTKRRHGQVRTLIQRLLIGNMIFVFKGLKKEEYEEEFYELEYIIHGKEKDTKRLNSAVWR